MVYPNVVKIILWILFKLIHILYIPVYICRIVQRSIKCAPVQNPLLLLRASELAEKIRNKQVTCELVISTYISRIKEVNHLLNAVIHERFEQAVRDAQKADDFIQNTELNPAEIALKYPLLGVPLTVKGSISVKDMYITAGRKDRNILAEKHAKIVQLLSEAGAIPLLTSNVPELCLNWETTNKLIGTTKNPYDSRRTVGGSSGGECALLASAGSIIGVGSDIAGSLRLPAHFCGVWGHKPSPGVVSGEGHYPDCKNRDKWNRVFTLGPLARYATDLRLLLEVIAEPEMRSTLDLNRTEDWNRMKIYYIEEIGSILSKSVSGETRSALQNVVTFFDRLLPVNKCEKLEINSMVYSAELSFLNLLSKDDIDNLFDNNGQGAYSELLKFFVGRSDHQLTSILYGVIRRHLNLLPKKMCHDFENHLEELGQDLVKSLGDNGVLLLPCFPQEAHYHGDVYKQVFDHGYLSIFNSLGFPVSTCPVGHTKKGLPIGIQVVASPNCDRLCLQVAEELERAFGGWKTVA